VVGLYEVRQFAVAVIDDPDPGDIDAEAVIYGYRASGPGYQLPDAPPPPEEPPPPEKPDPPELHELPEPPDVTVKTQMLACPLVVRSSTDFLYQALFLSISLATG